MSFDKEAHDRCDWPAKEATLDYLIDKKKKDAYIHSSRMALYDIFVVENYHIAELWESGIAEWWNEDKDYWEVGKDHTKFATVEDRKGKRKKIKGIGVFYVYWRKDRMKAVIIDQWQIMPGRWDERYRGRGLEKFFLVPIEEVILLDVTNNYKESYK